jgi:hypothetical protein
MLHQQAHDMPEPQIRGLRRMNRSRRSQTFLIANCCALADAEIISESRRNDK